MTPWLFKDLLQNQKRQLITILRIRQNKYKQSFHAIAWKDCTTFVAELLKKAILHKGFSVVEILSPCPTHYGRKNKEGDEVGMAIGMTFLLFALAHGSADLVSTLSATSPILILPIVWIATKEKPAPGAWIGAFPAVVGVASIFSP